MVSITIYDGAETIGGNKIFVEEKGKGVFLDFGMNFELHNAFFEEFLTERDSRGIHDHLYLDLIPKLNIYRDDLITTDVGRLMPAYPSLNVEAVLLSHAHLDHCGCIGMLKETIPIVASNTSIAILKAQRDTGQSRIASEIAYMSPKKKDDGGLLLKPEGREYIGRKFFCTCELSGNMEDFMSKKPGQDGKNSKKLKSGDIKCLDGTCMCFDVKAFEVDHSIYGSTAYVLQGETSVAYTGDIRLHGKNGGQTGDFIKEAKSSSILIIEGTRAGRDNDQNVTEDDVNRNCRSAVENSRGLVIADFSPRNLERLEMFISIAKKTGREPVITAKDAYMLHAIQCADGNERLKGLRIYDELKDKTRNKWETEVVSDRCKDDYVSHDSISKDPGRYILCFSYFDLKHLLDIKPKEGSYIYSSCEAFTEEMALDFKRLNKWLDYFHLKAYGFEMTANGDGQSIDFTKGYHASGHASKDDLTRIIDTIDPDVIIPVHTKDVNWFVENFENVNAIRKGETRDFN
ncbi:MBL fold metallo-hydrolase [Methanocella sp. CWC-04]|uniref:MBL fold metallo-hydrolase n=1 Tax=Methanooceanicella nereidis TaxID=2052831 RepID=A0AAP2RG45_9EURY|nr:MBL fold metallo-hydrolase [Methanocella sp. CWC-04]MCD1295607.1 MBL fold metallo-hydrolase [Methanocella sp. CWC-04]